MTDLLKQLEALVQASNPEKLYTAEFIAAIDATDFRALLDLLRRQQAVIDEAAAGLRFAKNGACRCAGAFTCSVCKALATAESAESARAAQQEGK